MVHVKDQIDPLPFRPLAIWSDYPGRSGVSAGTINAGCPHRAVTNACPPLTAPYGQVGASLELTVSCLVREKILVTPSAVHMLDSCAKHALSNGEGSRGAPSRVQFFPTTSGLELTGFSSCLPPSAYCVLPTAHSLLHTSYSLHSTPTLLPSYVSRPKGRGYRMMPIFHLPSYVSRPQGRGYRTIPVYALRLTIHEITIFFFLFTSHAPSQYFLPFIHFPIFPRFTTHSLPSRITTHSSPSTIFIPSHESLDHRNRLRRTCPGSVFC
jgi:hypothetical protein